MQYQSVCHVNLLEQKNHLDWLSKKQFLKRRYFYQNKYESSDFVSVDLFTIKTTGLLPRGYEQEVPNSTFYGGIIYNDAAYGYILIENHVSIGAGKPSWEIWSLSNGFVIRQQLRSRISMGIM